MFVGVIFSDFNFHIIIIFKSFFGFFLAMILKLVNFNNPEKRNSSLTHKSLFWTSEPKIDAYLN